MRNYIKQNMRVIIGFTVGLIIFILILAIIVNFITKWDLGFDVSKNSTWISFYAAMIAAIVGGVISGGLTLLGVIHTINSQEKNEKRNQLPRKIMESHKLYEKIKFMEKDFKDTNKLEVLKITNIPYESRDFLPESSIKGMKDLVNNLLESKQQYLESAASVNFELYDNVNLIFGRINNIDKIVNANELSVVLKDYDGEIDNSNVLGYDKSIYDKIKLELEDINLLIGFVEKTISRLEKEYTELSN